MRALVLSGGGSKGSYQVGVLRKWILEDGLDYSIFTGTSVGAINAASLAQAPPTRLREQYRVLRAMWETLDQSDVHHPWPRGIPEALWKSSVYDSSPIRTLIRKNLNVAALQASGRKLLVTAVSWRTGELVTAHEETPEIAEWVYASASFPVFFAPASIQGELYTDGGVREIAPLRHAIALGATEIDVIITSDPEVPDDWSTVGKVAFNYALRTVDIMSTEILLNDVRVCQLTNRLVEAGAAPTKRLIRIRVMKPSSPLGDSLTFAPESIQTMMVQGYCDARREPRSCR